MEADKNNHDNYHDIENLLHKVSYLLQDRLSKKPEYGVYIHARQQVDMILNQFRENNVMIDFNFVDVDVMAAKELEDPDPELADSLEEVVYRLRKFCDQKRLKE